MESFSNDEKDKVEDSLEFCADIYRYYKKPPEASKGVYKKYSFKKKADRKQADIKTDAVAIPYNNSLNIKESDKDRQRALGTVRRLIIICVAAFVLALSVRTFVFQETIVQGSSMKPTFQNGDKLLLSKISYTITKPKRYDVVVFTTPENELFIKRVIGLPGETVAISGGSIYINNKQLLDDPVAEDIKYAGRAEEGVTLAENEYFVLGDNRANSFDSRYDSVGDVNIKNIDGKIFLRLGSIGKFELVK